MKMHMFLPLMVMGCFLQACTAVPVRDEAIQTKEEIVWVEDTRTTLEKQTESLDMAMMFSNDNVLYYPLDQDVNDMPQKFPEYRGVLDNTTASGYTVFDSSVTVYAIEGDVQAKPSYLPHYSVPQHAAQYGRQLKPGVKSMSPVSDDTRNRPIRLIQYQDQAEVMSLPPTQKKRIPPMLTGY